MGRENNIDVKEIRMSGNKMVFFICFLELFFKDIRVAYLLATEIDALKSYIMTSAYNTRLSLYLNHQFIQKSFANRMDSEIRYLIHRPRYIDRKI